VSIELIKLFFLEVLLGGAGAVLGSILGNSFGRGGLFAGAVIGGVVMVAIAGHLACRFNCVHRSERFWVIGGGIAGFLVACLVTLATLSSPIGPVLSALLIGVGAVLGSLLGRSPHGQP
jgi:hypothetical protein